MRRRLIFAAAVTVVTGCRLNPDCFGENECRDGFVCSQGECVHPDFLVAEAGVEPDGGGINTLDPTWCEVQQVVNDRCLPCHGNPPTSGAPRSLITYADTQVVGPGGLWMYQIMANRMSATQARMPPPSATQPAQLEIDTVVAWAARAAPDCDTNVRDAGMAGRDAGPTPDAGPLRDGGPARDGGPVPDSGPFNPLTRIAANATQLGIGTAFVNVAGVLWRPDPGVVLFADPPGDTVFSATPPAFGLAPFRTASRNTNGLANDPNGDLVVTELIGRRVARQQGTTYVTVIERYEGMRLNSPNDVAIRSDGVLYFSDPPYGITPQMREIPFNGIYSYVTTATTPPLRVEFMGAADTQFPSGLELSPDELTLYMSDAMTGTLYAFDVRPNGRLANRREFGQETPVVDGIAVDVWGNVYFGTSGGIVVYDETGLRLGVVDAVPGPVNRVAFGGEDLRTLFVTASDRIYSVAVDVPGVR